MSEGALRACAAARTRGAIALAFCRHLEAQGVAYALLGDPRALEGAGPPGDVDLALDPASARGWPALVGEFCAREGLRLVQVLQHEWSAASFVVAGRPQLGAPLQVLYLDLYGDYVRGARCWISAHELLGRRVRGAAQAGAPGPFTPAPDLLCLAYLLKKVAKGGLEPEHAAFLGSLWERDPAGCRTQLRRFWPEPSVERLARGLAGHPDALRAALPQLARELARAARPRPRERLRDLVRRARRALRPAGYWLVLLGPDGAGKSTAAEHIRRELGPAFRRSAFYHLRPHLLGRAAGGTPTSEPHSAPARGRAASAAKLGLWWLDCTLGFALRIAPELWRSGLVVFDRHALDLAVDPVRYRYRGSTRAAEWLLRRTFQPAFFAVLDAPVEVLHRRKQEVAAPEAERQREAYRALAARLPDAAVIDAARAPEQVGADVVDRVLERLARRTALRWGGAAPQVRGGGA